MDSAKLDDTFDFSALDALSSSSTPRIMRQEHEDRKLVNMPQTNEPRDDNRSPEGKATTTIGENEGSDYSIHLSAVMQSASSTLNLDRDILKIDSEDIGGPSDFTINLAEYINGTRSVKPKSGSPSTVKDTHQSPVSKEALTDAPTKHYMQPTVEDSFTPLPTRTVDVINRSEQRAEDRAHDPLASSQCLTTMLPLPQEDLQAQIEVLQQRCNSLQRNNAELNSMLESYRAQRSHDVQLIEQLRKERQLRNDEDAAGLEAQEAVEARLTIEKERAAALQKRLHEEKLAAARTQVETELAQQDALAQIAAWKQRAGEHQRRVTELQAQPEVIDNAPTKNEDAEVVQQLQAQLAAQTLTHEAEMAALKDEFEGVAKDVDEWIVAKVEKRERHYAAIEARRQAEMSKLKARNKELERLYALCGKELMLSWGREEFGPAQNGAKQKYRYQHA